MKWSRTWSVLQHEPVAVPWTHLLTGPARPVAQGATGRAWTTWLALSAPVLPRFEPSGDAASAIQTDIDGSTNHSATRGVCHPEGDVRWRFDGEFTRRAPAICAICRAARRISSTSRPASVDRILELLVFILFRPRGT